MKALREVALLYLKRKAELLDCFSERKRVILAKKRSRKVGSQARSQASSAAQPFAVKVDILHYGMFAFP